ncbi:molybdopterin molybdotransferase MoeA [Roseibacillus persicicus]|uniref:molybdopterin molybdotransferase MoeA n=1 Tax=Roseibacillus persicicus TaxID=454148 RepID=UPI00398A64A1
MSPLLTPAQADELIRQDLTALPCEALPYLSALGRTLRQSLSADQDFPPFDRVTMDGIACRSSDLSLGPLTIQGLHPAGEPAPAPLQPAHCWQIMTGAVMPSDCDTIIPVEELSISGTLVTVLESAAPTPGQFIHRQASDCAAGTELLTAGTVITPAHLGLAATVGAVELTVTCQPSVTILTTGDELVPPTETPLPHQLRQSNGPVLLSALANWGLNHSSTHLHLPDDLTHTTEAIESALSSSDLVLISGGISKGKKDYVRPALESLIGPPTFHGIAQRPGKPLAYWKPSSQNPPLFALPGNPNSTLTTFLRYVRPALHLLAGSPIPEPITLPLAKPLTPHPKLTLFLPATLESNGTLTVHQPQNSGDFASALSASGFIEVPSGEVEVTTAAYHPNNR